MNVKGVSMYFVRSFLFSPFILEIYIFYYKKVKMRAFFSKTRIYSFIT
jgi:hypothetical protein